MSEEILTELRISSARQEEKIDNVVNLLKESAKQHKNHRDCCESNKVDIGKINSRHGTYWKVVGSFGGLGGLLVGFTKYFQ